MNFRSDNEAGAHPAIIEAVSRAFPAGPVPSYGADDWTQKVEHRLREIFEKPDLVRLSRWPPAPPPTCWRSPAARRRGARSSAIPPPTSRSTRPTRRNSSPRAPSSCLIDGPAGKIDPKKLAEALAQPVYGVVHHPQPAAVSITQATECGTVYAPEEIAAIATLDASPWAEAAHGRRALRQCAVLRRLLAGRAVVEGRRRRAEPRRHQERRHGRRGRGLLRCRRWRSEFEFRRKRGGHLFSKMRLLSSQLDAYFTDGLWLDNARHANAMARRLVAGPDAAQGHVSFSIRSTPTRSSWSCRRTCTMRCRPRARSTIPGRPTGRASAPSGSSPPSTPIPPTSTDSSSIAKASVSSHDPSAYAHRRPLGRLRSRVRRQGPGREAASLLEGPRSLADRPAHAVRRGDAAARAPAGRPQELARARARARNPTSAARSRSSSCRGTRRSTSSPASSTRVKDEHSNRAIFGGSYGWSSAGRFHHAQSQVHRFLNAIGGYVRHMDSYSLGAARVLMPHIVAPHGRADGHAHDAGTCWPSTASCSSPSAACRARTRRSTPAAPWCITLKDGLYGMRAKGVRFVNVTPTAEDLDTGGDVEWLAIRPNTDAAMMLALCHVLLTEKLLRPRLPRPLHGRLRQVRALPRRQGRRTGPRRSPAFPPRASAASRARWRRRAPRSTSAGRCSAAITASSRSGRW